MQEHRWKTPFEIVVRGAPNLNHLRKIGCKIYFLDKHILCKQKLQEHAHISHLIGYDSINIFCIWIPNQRKIICTRDVQFDKNSFYNSAQSELDLSQLVLEPIIETTYAILLLNSAAQITEIESNKDKWELNFLARPRLDTNQDFNTGGEKDDNFHDDFYDASTETDEF